MLTQWKEKGKHEMEAFNKKKINLKKRNLKRRHKIKLQASLFQKVNSFKQPLKGNSKQNQ